MKYMGLPPLEQAALCGWPAPLMSPVQAAPGLLLYFAMPTTRTKRLSRALAVPSLREGWGIGCGKRRNQFPSYHQHGERSRPLGMRRSEVKEEVGRSPAGGHERSRVPKGLLRFHRATIKHQTTSNQHPSSFKRTTP